MSEPAGPRRPICCPPHSCASLILIYSLTTTISLAQCSWSPRSFHCAVPLKDRDLVPEEQHCLPPRATVCQGLVCWTPWLIPMASSSLAPVQSCCSVLGSVLGPKEGVAALALVGISGCPLVQSLMATSRAPGTVPMAPHCTWGLGAAGSVPLGPLLGCSDERGTLGLPGQLIPAGASLRWERGPGASWHLAG